MQLEKNGLQTNLSKINGIKLRGGAYTQESFIFQKMNIKSDCQGAPFTDVCNKFYSMNTLKYKKRQNLMKQPKKKTKIMLFEIFRHNNDKVSEQNA